MKALKGSFKSIDIVSYALEVSVNGVGRFACVFVVLGLQQTHFRVCPHPRDWGNVVLRKALK